MTSPATSRRRIDPSLASFLLVGVILAALAWVLPKSSRNPLLETAVWSVLNLVAYAGWGSLVLLAVGARRVDLGLRVAWGMGLVCFLGGALMVPALMTRTMAFVVVEIGLGLACVALVRERAAVGRRIRFATRLVRRQPGLAVASLVIVGLVALPCLGAIADWHTNPYDDDIAYLPLLKKLADTGTILEPFSFRRLSAYGGQTLFLELVNLRAAVSQSHAFDRCVCFLVVVLLVIGHRSRGQRPSWLVVASLLVMLVLLPSTTINTGSYWSGVAVYLGLYRTLVWADEGDRAAWRSALPIALVAACGCTLRQNYLAVSVFVVALSCAVMVLRARGPFVRRLVEPGVIAGFTAVALLPWMIVSWQSSRTFLFPILLGTFNPNLELKASAWNIIREIAFQCDVALQGLPLKTLPFFLLAALFTKERPSTRAPLLAVTLGSIGAFWFLVHSFSQSDAGNIGRYAFGFMAPVAIAVALSTGRMRLARRSDPRLVPAGIALFAILGQILVLSRDDIQKDWTLKFHNIENQAFAASRVRESEPPEHGIYLRLQEAVPAGERIAVLVDEPFYLDYARNPIWNLDMPGYASLAPGMPFFQGSEALEAYYRQIGVRYLMFVIPDASRYHFRREYFLELFVNETELWRTYGPYLVDYLDSETALRKRHRRVALERGIIVIDLGDPKPANETPDGVPSFATEDWSDGRYDAGAGDAGIGDAGKESAQ